MWKLDCWSTGMNAKWGFHVFHCSSVHALGLRQVFSRMIEIDHIISHPFPTPFSLLLVHPRSWGDIGRSYILPLPNFVIFHQGGETIGSITGKQSTIAQGNWCRSGMHGLCNLATNGEMEPYLIPKKVAGKKYDTKKTVARERGWCKITHLFLVELCRISLFGKFQRCFLVAYV